MPHFDHLSARFDQIATLADVGHLTHSDQHHRLRGGRTVGDQLLLSALGVTVVEVPDLDVEVCYISDRHVGLIRAGLPEAALRRAYDWLLRVASEAA